MALYGNLFYNTEINFGKSVCPSDNSDERLSIQKVSPIRRYVCPLQKSGMFIAGWGT
jgi:hypothetical protein